MADLSNDSMVHIKRGQIEYLQFRRLMEYKELINCYTLSINNIDFNKNGPNADANKLEKSMQVICDEFNINQNEIIRPHQSHTDRIEKVNKLDVEYIDVDGLLTNKGKIDLMLSYADCTPILLYDSAKKVIGNIHSGWKGTVQKIGQKAVLKMIEEYNSKPENIIACLGPCIKQCHFEVREDVKSMFEDTFRYLNRNDDIIKKSNSENGKFYIDTTLINELLLKEVGLVEDNIVDSGICTVCNSKYLHSYRVEKEKSGRNIALIGLK